MKDMEHIVERSRFADQAGRSKTATVTTRRLDPGHTLAVAAAGTLLVLVAFTVPLTTLADTAAGLGAGPGAQAWVLSSMSLGSAAGLLSSGAIGDDYGRRRTFVAGALLLGLGLAALLAALAAGAGILALSTVVPTLIERGLGEGAVLASVVLLAWSATSVVTALGARWLPPWMSPRVQLVGGLVGVAVGQLALVGLAPDSSVARLLPAERAAMGSGANNTARYVGSAIGIAVVTVLVTHAGAASGAAGVVSGWNVAVLVTAGVSLLGALAVLLARERISRSEPDGSGPAGPS